MDIITSRAGAPLLLADSMNASVGDATNGAAHSGRWHSLRSRFAEPIVSVQSHAIKITKGLEDFRGQFPEFNPSSLFNVDDEPMPECIEWEDYITRWTPSARNAAAYDELRVMLAEFAEVQRKLTRKRQLVLQGGGGGGGNSKGGGRERDRRRSRMSVADATGGLDESFVDDGGDADDAPVPKRRK
jgi:hypothetical protein